MPLVDQYAFPVTDNIVNANGIYYPVTNKFINKMPSTQKVLFPITNKFIIKPDFNLDNYHGEILECYNCFLPDHPYWTTNLIGYGTVYQGGINYVPSDSNLISPYAKSHIFEIDIVFAFTPLSSYFTTGFERLCTIGYDGDYFPSVDENALYTYPSYWDSVFQNTVRPIWEANAIAAYSRGGTHGFSITADDWTPDYPDEPRNSGFLDYCEIFDYIPFNNEHKWFTNVDAKKILSYSSHHTIIPKMSTINARAGSALGPDWFPADFSAYSCNFTGSPSIIESPTTPFVFWIYDYSHYLGVTLQNLESKVEWEDSTPLSRCVFPLGYIPHDDATGPQNGVWGYRWISNQYKYAPWDRYPDL
jgi:hypothetical protein